MRASGRRSPSSVACWRLLVLARFRVLGETHLYHQKPKVVFSASSPISSVRAAAICQLPLAARQPRRAPGHLGAISSRRAAGWAPPPPPSRPGRRRRACPEISISLPGAPRSARTADPPPRRVPTGRPLSRSGGPPSSQPRGPRRARRGGATVVQAPTELS